MGSEMKSERITLTGADEHTDIDELLELANRHPAVEIGLLYTATPEGRPRYPSLPWLLQAASALSGRVAIHVCGAGARSALQSGDLRSLLRHAPRVQVNGQLYCGEAELLALKVGTLITQHNAVNQSLLIVRARNHDLLVDSSGGRGLSPADWTPPVTSKNVGFAGGMGPDNLATELARIQSVAKSGSWADMEGKLRVDDWFSVPLARQCAEVFDTHLNGASEALRTRAAAAPRMRA